MEFDERLLPGRKRADIDGLVSIDPHSLKRRSMRDRRNDQSTSVFKPDEPAIK